MDRDKYTHPPMTNADRLNTMTIEEKAEFISSIAYGRETPWSEPFSRRMCDSCPTVHGTYEGGIEDDFHECDFVDGECPHGSAIVWWLKQPAEDDDHSICGATGLPCIKCNPGGCNNRKEGADNDT